MGITVAALREHVQTPLPDAELTRLLEAAVNAVTPSEGAVVLAPVGRYVPLPRPAAGITAVREDGTLLAANDYTLSSTGSLLTRRSDGTNPRRTWGTPVEVTYTVADEDPVRDAAVIKLVQLDVQWSPGLASQSIGDWSETYRAPTDYIAARRQIIAEAVGEGATWPR